MASASGNMATHAWSGGFDAVTWAQLCAALHAVRRGRVLAVQQPRTLLEAAARVGVTELVRRALGEAEVQDEAARQSRKAQHTLHRVHTALDGAGISHVFWKGAFADAVLWGGGGVREGGDLDVLVEPEDFERVERLLGALGWVPSPDDGMRASKRAAKAWVMLPAREELIPVDVHRRPLNSPPFSSSSADALAHKQMFTTPLGQLPGACAAVQVVMIAGNLAGGRFQGELRLAADAACLWERPDCDVALLLDVARRWKAEAAVWGLLRLLQARFDVVVDATLLQQVAPPQGARRLIERAFGVMGAPRMPRTQLEALLLVDWPLASRGAWVAEKVAHKVVLSLADRAAEALLRIQSRVSRGAANVGAERERTMAITESTRVTVPPDVLLQEIEGESVLLDLRTETYFGLDESGTLLFQALKTSGSVAGALAAGLEAFEVERAVLSADLIELVQQLEAAGLVQVEP